MATYEHPNASSLSMKAPSWLKAGYWLCTLIAVAAVIRRLVALSRPSQGGPPQLGALDATFASHVTLTLAHIIPALVFVLLVPLVLFRLVHAAWPEQLLFPLGAIVGATAYAMSVFAIGGWVERSAVLVFNTVFLISLAKAYRFAHRGEQWLKRRWLIRAVGTLLGIATTRPVMGVFFATSARTHLAPNQFFGIAFWIGFSINVIIVELWIYHQRSRSQLQGNALTRAS